MMIESTLRIYNSIGKVVPVWSLDTDTYTVYHNAEKGDEDKTSYHSECIRYHINYVMQHPPDRLEALVDSGEIKNYLDELESRINAAIDEQVELWKKTDKEYLLAVADDNNVHKTQLANIFDMKAKEAIYAAMVYR